MFEKKFMEMIYRKAAKPEDLLWHVEEPAPYLMKAIPVSSVLHFSVSSVVNAFFNHRGHSGLHRGHRVDVMHPQTMSRTR